MQNLREGILGEGAASLDQSWFGFLCPAPFQGDPVVSVVHHHEPVLIICLPDYRSAG